MSRPSDTFSTSLALANSLAHIMLQLNPVEFVTPTNLQQEKETWIAAAQGGIFGNPRFTYDFDLLTGATNRYLDPLTEVRKNYDSNLRVFSPIDEVIKDILLGRIDDAILTVKMAQSILDHDDRETSSLSRQKYGQPGSDVIATAMIMAETKENFLGDFPSRFTAEEIATLKAMSFNAEQIKYWFERAMSIYDIHNWNITISDDVSAIDVRDKTASGTPTVFIPTSRRVDGLKLLELIGHEINCHLLDSTNANALLRGLIQNNPCLLPLIPVMAKSDDELLYEAHAKLSDVSVNGTSAIPKPYYVVAQNLARKGKNFSEVAYAIYELQERTTNKKPKALATSAWTVAYRVFRGCTNPEKPNGYVFWKDYAYLGGYLFMRQNQDPSFLNYSTMTPDEIEMLKAVGVDLTHPAYPQQDIVRIIKDQLLA